MDPVSLFSLVGLCATIASRAVRIVFDLHALQERYRNVNLSVQLLITQITALQVASDRISSWLSSYFDCLSEIEYSGLARSLAACEYLVGCLHDHMVSTLGDSSRLGFATQTKWLWNEGIVREYRDMLQSQVQALCFHLQVLALNRLATQVSIPPLIQTVPFPTRLHYGHPTDFRRPSSQERQTMFSSKLAKKLMKKAEDDASSSSLRPLRDNESQHTSHTVRSQESSLSGVSRTFEFDEDVVSSRAYRNAMSSLMRNNDTAQSKDSRSESSATKDNPAAKQTDTPLPSRTPTSHQTHNPHSHVALREFEQLRNNLAEAGDADALANLRNNSCLLEIPTRTFPWCLRRAIDHGSIECVAALFQHGTDLESTDGFAQTPFLYACWVGQTKVAIYLYEQGARIETKNSAGETPLHIATQRQDLELINNLLDWGADVDCKDTRGDSPLHLAALLTNGTAATVLLARGATIQKKNSRGETPFTQALLAPNSAIISTFLMQERVTNSVKAQIESYVSLLVGKILTEEDEVQQIASWPADPNFQLHLHASCMRLRAFIQCLDTLLSTLSYSPVRFAPILNRSTLLRTCFFDPTVVAKRALTSAGKDPNTNTLEWLTSASAEAISTCISGLYSTPAPRRAFLLHRPKPKATIAEVLAEEPQPDFSFGQNIRVEITTQVELIKSEDRWVEQGGGTGSRDEDSLALRAAGYASSSSRSSSALVSVGV